VVNMADELADGTTVDPVALHTSPTAAPAPTSTPAPAPAAKDATRPANAVK